MVRLKLNISFKRFQSASFVRKISVKYADLFGPCGPEYVNQSSINSDECLMFGSSLDFKAVIGFSVTRRQVVNLIRLAKLILTFISPGG